MCRSSVKSEIKNMFSFELDENGLPTLCEKNFAIVEFLIENDSDYRKPNIRDKNYEMILSEGIPSTKQDVKKVVELIDKANSTHLASEGQKYKKQNRGRIITADKIYDLIKSGELKSALENKDTQIVHTIADAVNQRHRDEKNHLCEKYNFSFATKFCAYTSIFALKSDNYCIYDKVVRDVLPYYAKMYIGEKYWNKGRKYIKSKFENCRGAEGYEDYRNVIDKILSAAESKHEYKISYKEFDNLLWYYFKGEPSRKNKAYDVLKNKGVL